MDAKQVCERCDYDEIEGDEHDVPDIWQDRYLYLCKCCQKEGHRIQDKFEGGFWND